MRKIVASLCLLAAGFVLSGCTITHNIAEDYAAYLAGNTGTGLPQTKLDAKYSLTPQTAASKYEFRAATAGQGNLWVVEFGQILDATLQSTDVQKSFASLTKLGAGESAAGTVITFDLRSYTYSGHSAHITLDIALTKAGKEVFKRAYLADGNNQAGKTVWGGAFAMRNAVQQSTKFALDQILKNFLSDIQNVK